MPAVRLATEEDIPAVAALLAEFRDFWRRDEPAGEAIAAGVARLMAGGDAEFLVAGAPDGFAQLRYRYVLWTDSEECQLEDLYVREAARRVGLGRALAVAAIERARERGCRRMQLDANEANPPAIALYESLGFSSWFDPPGGRNLNLRLPL